MNHLEAARTRYWKQDRFATKIKMQDKNNPVPYCPVNPTLVIPKAFEIVFTSPGTADKVVSRPCLPAKTGSPKER
jgi:hypothetical protein